MDDNMCLAEDKWSDQDVAGLLFKYMMESHQGIRVEKCDLKSQHEY